MRPHGLIVTVALAASAAGPAGGLRAQGPVGAVSVEVTVGAQGAARVEERYVVAPFRGAVEMRALVGPCADIGSVLVERFGAEVPMLREGDGPWLVLRETASAAVGDTLRLLVRYDVGWSGSRPDVPLLHLTTPIPQEDGEREGTVGVVVRFADVPGRVVFPHMERRAPTAWEARYVAIPSFVQLSVPPAVGMERADCQPGRGRAGSDGGLVWRFLLLVGIMGAWVPLYLVWARRSGDEGE